MYTSRLKSFEVVTCEDGRRMFKAIYEQENDNEIIKKVITCPVNLYNDPVTSISPSIYDTYHLFNSIEVDFGFGSFSGAQIESRLIKTKTKEMTVAEIEEALGYKVKIVDK